MTTSIKNIPVSTACRIHFLLVNNVYTKLLRMWHVMDVNIHVQQDVKRLKLDFPVEFWLYKLYICISSCARRPVFRTGSLEVHRVSFQRQQIYKYIIRRLDSGSFISSNLAYWALAYSIAICPEMVSCLEKLTSMDLWLQTWVFLDFSFWSFLEHSGGSHLSVLDGR